MLLLLQLLMGLLGLLSIRQLLILHLCGTQTRWDALLSLLGPALLLLLLLLRRSWRLAERLLWLLLRPLRLLHRLLRRQHR